MVMRYDDAYKSYYKKKFDFKRSFLVVLMAFRNKKVYELVTGRFGKELDYELIGKLFPDFDSKVVDLAEGKSFH